MKGHILSAGLCVATALLLPGLCHAAASAGLPRFSYNPVLTAHPEKPVLIPLVCRAEERAPQAAETSTPD